MTPLADGTTFVGMHSAAAWFALVVAGIGWFYIFGSQSAHRLGALESAPANRRRIGLRCVNGACLIILATCLFALVYCISAADRPVMFLAICLAVLVLLVVSVALAMVDLRLTIRLRQSLADRRKDGAH